MNGFFDGSLLRVYQNKEHRPQRDPLKQCLKQIPCFNKFYRSKFTLKQHQTSIQLTSWATGKKRSFAPLLTTTFHISTVQGTISLTTVIKYTNDTAVPDCRPEVVPYHIDIVSILLSLIQMRIMAWRIFLTQQDSLWAWDQQLDSKLHLHFQQFKSQMYFL